MGKINVEEAKQRLQNPVTFSASKKAKKTTTAEESEIKLIDSVNDNLFIFEKDGSYILSPADDTLDPVIGEFDEIPEDGSMPPCMKDWLDTYSKEINYFQNNEEELLAEFDEETMADGDTWGSIELIDLGLSVKWANMNIGAASVEDAGNYYAWGELDTKTNYTIAEYKYYNSKSKSYIKVDTNISKNDQYDVAYKIDTKLCMPTKEQFTELIDKCTWTKTKLNNVTVWEVKGPNGNKIYFPLTGCKSESAKVSYTTYGYCWTSTNGSSEHQAYTFRVTDKPGIYAMYKRTGATIRAVESKIDADTKPIDGTVNGKKTIQPFIPYKWGQRAPYSNQLPKDPATGKTVVTGCTQTALAMILAYYANIGINGKKFRRGMTKTEAYISKKGTKSELSIPALPPKISFDWDNMNFYKSGDFKTEESKNAVAELMKYLAYGSKAAFTSSGTGATVTNELKTAAEKMHWSNTGKQIYASSGLESFKDQIYKEIEQGYPVHVSGWASDGKSGHSFVCDGYNAKTGKFHFNWGWNGSYDGWFDMALLKPSSSNDFSYSKRAIVGLHPNYVFGDTNNDDEISITDVMNVLQSIFDKKAYDYKLDMNYDGKITETDAQILIEYMLGKRK